MKSCGCQKHIKMPRVVSFLFGNIFDPYINTISIYEWILQEEELRRYDRHMAEVVGYAFMKV